MSSPSLESLDQEIIVRAGAGAGKTTELVSRVLSFVTAHREQKNRDPRIVVTTFTRKATQELRERLMKKALELKDESLVEFIQKESGLHISTIHGVLSLFLARFGYCIGLTPNFSFIEMNQEERMIKKIIRNLLSQPEYATSLETLLEERTLTRLIESILKYIEASSSQAAGLQLVNFQALHDAIRKKDAVWISRALELLNYIESNEKSDKWQSYAALLKLTIEKLKTASIQERQGVYQHFNESKERVVFKKGTDESMKDLKSDLQDEAKACALNWADSAEAVEKHNEVGLAFEKIAQTVATRLYENKISSAQMTMSDLETISLSLIQKFPETAESFSKEWDYWMVDEYQDTSPRQVTLLKALIGKKNSFTVGDPQQSIYLFRGARSEVFLEKESQVKKAKGQHLQKMENYRSRPELLQFFNHFFSQLNPQFKNMIPTDRASRPDLKDSAAAIFIQSEDEDQAEYINVLNRIQDLLEQKVSAENICVLSLTNQELDKLARLAIKFNIPVQVHASAKFYLRREVQDALSVMKFLVNPYNNINLIELLRSPWFRIPDSELIKISHHQDQSYWKNAKDLLGENEKITTLRTALEEAGKKGVSQVWISLLQSSGLLETATFIDPTCRREANLWKLIHQLKAEERSPGFSYLEFSDRTESALMNLESQSDSDATPIEEPKRVNLMTIHASKGLQFDHVIIPFMGKMNLKKQSDFFIYDEESQQFSISLTDPDDGKMSVTTFADQVLEKNKHREFQEYDRLLYVAMTRAKVDVTLIWSKVRKDSWADRMWKSETGEFFTKMIRDQKVEMQVYQESHISSVKTIPEKLHLQMESKNPAVVSVTSLLDFENRKTSGSILRADQIAARAEKAQAGVTMHRLFESLKFRSLDEVEKISALSKEVQFIKTWNQGQILEWISQGEVEWGFCLEHNEKWIQGQIDLWSVHQNQLWVVDYKTGSESFKSMAIDQLNIYAWALKKMKKVPNLMETNLVVIYPHIEKIHIEKAKDHVL